MNKLITKRSFAKRGQDPFGQSPLGAVPAKGSCPLFAKPATPTGQRANVSIATRLVIVLGLLAAVTTQVRAQDGGQPPGPAARPLIRAHAHNDYHHPRPLLDALDHGFCSVEADIFLVDGQLLVGHTTLELTPQRTLQALYLDPLRRRVQDNGGRVYRDGPRFTLMIDVKTDAGRTYAALGDVLSGYAEMLTAVRNGVVEEGAVTVIISGNRAEQAVADAPLRYVGIDGRLVDLDTTRPSHLVPLISDNWRSHFRWRGQGPMPDEEQQKLRTIVQKAHAKGRRVRFWATPDDPAVWRELVDARVDLLNADDLAGLERFLSSQNPK